MPQEKKAASRILTVPNAMSALRILIVPVFAALYLRGHVAAAVGALVFSGLTDMLDGLIARRFNQITDLGKMLDPFADKLTQGVVALCIAIRFPSKRYGKVATVMFYVSVSAIVLLDGLGIMGPDKQNIAAFVMLGLTGIMMAYAAVKYFQIFLAILREPGEKEKK